MPYLAKILVYPIKSLDGVEVSQARILPGGALENDREFALFDPQGRVVNGKRTAKIHQLRSTFDLAARTVSLRIQDQEQEYHFHLDSDRSDLAQWLSEFLGDTITLQQNQQMGFPDDTVASGPTVVSTATLQQVASWFPDLTLEQIRNRFRANLEIEAAPAFWEDQILGEADQLIPFQIGEVKLWGSNPCQRCIVPTRNPFTGETNPHFQKEFVAQRQATLPTWAVSSRFNHFYKLTLNTRVFADEAGKHLSLQDPITIE